MSCFAGELLEGIRSGAVALRHEQPKRIVVKGLQEIAESIHDRQGLGAVFDHPAFKKWYIYFRPRSKSECSNI